MVGAVDVTKIGAGTVPVAESLVTGAVGIIGSTTVGASGLVVAPAPPPLPPVDADPPLAADPPPPDEAALAEPPLAAEPVPPLAAVPVPADPAAVPPDAADPVEAALPGDAPAAAVAGGGVPSAAVGGVVPSASVGGVVGVGGIAGGGVSPAAPAAALAPPPPPDAAEGGVGVGAGTVKPTLNPPDEAPTMVTIDVPNPSNPPPTLTSYLPADDGFVIRCVPSEVFVPIRIATSAPSTISEAPTSVGGVRVIVCPEIAAPHTPAAGVEAIVSFTS